MQPAPLPSLTADELRRMAAEMERCAAQLRAAADQRTAAERALAQARQGAQRVLEWGQQEKAA